MSEPILLCEDRDGIRTLTLNNPAARNALSGTMMALLHEAFVAAAAEPAVRVVILAANGPAFCAGHDHLRSRFIPDERLSFFTANWTICPCAAWRLTSLVVKSP